MSRNSITKNKKAFLLVEVLITVVVLSVGLTLIARSMITSLSALDIISQYAEGNSLVEDKIWELENRGSIQPDVKIEENFPEPFENFVYTIETENLLDKEDLLTKVSLSVVWPTKRDKREISLVTYLINEDNE